MTEITILALDPSSKSTGYAVFTNEKLVDYGCITAGSANLFNRIDRMIEELEKIIQKYDFTHVYIEDVYPEDVRNNIQVYKALTYLQGFILHLLNKYDLKHTFFTSAEWRKKCGIHTGPGVKRESLKPLDIKFVQDQFGIKVNDDVADAISIGFAAIGGKIIKSQSITTDDGFEFF